MTQNLAITKYSFQRAHEGNSGPRVLARFGDRAG